MQWRYCPFCGNISIKKKSDGFYYCPRCGWEGIPEEGDMTAINAVARKYVPGTKWVPPEKTADEKNSNEIKTKPLEEKEIKNVPKNKEIIEKLKQKQFSDVEFL